MRNHDRMLVRVAQTGFKIGAPAIKEILGFFVKTQNRNFNPL